MRTIAPWDMIKIRSAVKDLQDKYKEYTPPVSVEKIINGEKIVVKYHSRVEAGFPIVVKKGQEYGILICSIYGEKVARWHMACALGGIVLGLVDSGADSWKEDRMEEESRIYVEKKMDIFAGELLIPERWIESFLSNSCSLNDLERAQVLCGVPMDKLIQRLRLWSTAAHRRFRQSESLRINRERFADLPLSSQ
ncbi:MAG: hypothetical protein PWQ39_386 [Thermacetogenium sp.]|nr:hypothetical protein [Thermacetogenium sp.]